MQHSKVNTVFIPAVSLTDDGATGDHGRSTVYGFGNSEANQTETLGREVCEAAIHTALADPVVLRVPGLVPGVLPQRVNHEAAHTSEDSALQAPPLPRGVQVGHLHALEARHVAGDDKPKM